MSSRRKVLQLLKPGTSLASICIVLGSIAANTQALPPSTALPVVFTRTLKAGQARPGEIVILKTTQVIQFPNLQTLPAGTVLLGHVVQSTAFSFDSSPYAVQKPSVLSIRFDTLAESGSNLPVVLVARAIAGSIASYDAEIPHFRDEIDSVGTRVLIGGSSFSPIEAAVNNFEGDIVAYNRPNGAFARLLASESVNANFTCKASSSEESVGIFSPDACGIYGLNTVSMASNGLSGDGTIVLESLRQSVELSAGSTALLQAVSR